MRMIAVQGGRVTLEVNGQRYHPAT